MRNAFGSVAAVCLAASVTATGCGREPREPARDADSTRTTRQRIVALEATRNFGAGELQRGLAHPDARVRRAAAVALGRIQDPRALPWLASVLDDRERSVGVAAAFAIGQLQDVSESDRFRIQEALLPFVEARADSGVFPYLDALTKQGGAEIIPIIAVHLATGMAAGSEDARPPQVEGAAAWGLARIATPLAFNVLRQAGSLRGRAPRAACWIASAMADDPGVAAGRARRTASPDTLFGATLKTLLDHHDATARAAGARALGKRGDAAALAALLPHLSDTDWRVRASILTAIADLATVTRDKTQAREFCAALLSDRHPLVREAAAEALDRLGLGTHANLLQPALADSTPAVRSAALRCAVHGKMPGLQAAWTAARGDGVDFVRAQALDASVDVWGAAVGTDTLLAALRSPRVRERTAAAEALGRAPATARTRAVAALVEALADADFAVASTAADALATLEAATAIPALAGCYAARSTSRADAEVRQAVVTAAAALALEAPGNARAAALDLLQRAGGDADARVARAALAGQARLRGEDTTQPVQAAATDRAWAGGDSLPTIDLGRVRVRLVTTHGDAVLQLDGDDYPRTVANFLRLVDAGFYDDGVFHRVVPSFVVQGGCPRGDGWGDAGYTIPCEYGDLRYDAPGVVGMAHAGKDTGGSQFFITHVPVPRLDGRYTAFGRVVQGMDVVERIVRGDRFRIVREAAAPAAAAQ